MPQRQVTLSEGKRVEAILEDRMRGRSPNSFLSVVAIAALLLLGLVLAVIQSYRPH